MTNVGFYPVVDINDVACTSETICTFLRRLKPFLTPETTGLFNNPTVNACDDTLRMVDEVFDGNWKRNAPYSPRLQPIEGGFSLVRQNWKEASISRSNAERVLRNAFAYYSIGGLGGHVCISFFNIYRDWNNADNDNKYIICNK